MTSKRTISIVGAHTEGEVYDFLIGGVLDLMHCKTMFNKLCYFRDEADKIRQLFMQDLRGRASQYMNLVRPLRFPC